MKKTFLILTVIVLLLSILSVSVKVFSADDYTIGRQDWHAPISWTFII